MTRGMAKPLRSRAPRSVPIIPQFTCLFMATMVEKLSPSRSFLMEEFGSPDSWMRNPTRERPSRKKRTSERRM